MTPVSRCEHPYRLTGRQAESVLAQYRPEENDTTHRYAIRDIFREHFDGYVSENPVPFYKDKAVRAMMKCGTGELGYSLSVCTSCGKIQMSADKCGCRYCSQCGYLRKTCWVEERKSELIEGIPYFHVVFTVPHELNTLIYQNQRVLLNNLFRSVSHTILELCAERKMMVPGIVMALHTFGSAMTLHYHIHMLVSGGGLSLDKKKFKVQKSKGFFLPIKVVCARYRALFLQNLKKLHDSNKLEYFGEAEKYRNSYEWKGLLDSCYQKDWNVEIKKYFSPASAGSAQTDTAGNFSRYVNRNAISSENITRNGNTNLPDVPDVEAAENYLAEYCSRSAITDNRIRSADDKKVSFEYKDYRSGGERKIMTLSVHEFIRRFLLHILPKGTQKIRYGGFLAGSVKARSLALIRKLLKLEPRKNPVKGMTSSQLVKHLYGIDFSICPNCSSELSSAGHRMNSRRTAAAILAFTARAS